VDAQKRQKVMLAAVAVLALGAGSYWYLGRDSGGNKTVAIEEGTVKRKVVEAGKEPESRRKKETKAETRAEPPTIERREREAPEATTVERRKAREDRAKEKKKVVAPAA